MYVHKARVRRLNNEFIQQSARRTCDHDSGQLRQRIRRGGLVPTSWLRFRLLCGVVALEWRPILGLSKA